MKHKTVQSSNLKMVGYDEENNILEIVFKSGSIYQYAPVEKSTYEGLLSASSKGKYFFSHIKNAPYKVSRIK